MTTSIPSGFTSITSLPTVGTSSTTSSVQTQGANGTTATDGTSLNQDDFLQLLVAQLKYQDPTAPVDSSQFMQQTATYQEVQEIQQMTASSQSSLALQQGMAASNLVGKTVDYELADGTTGSGVVSSASFGVSSTEEPTLKIGSSDVLLSNVITVSDGSSS